MKTIGILLITVLVLASFSFADSTLENDLSSSLSTVSDNIDLEEDTQINTLYGEEQVQDEMDQPIENDGQQRQDLYDDVMGQ